MKFKHHESFQGYLHPSSFPESRCIRQATSLHLSCCKGILSYIPCSAKSFFNVDGYETHRSSGGKCYDCEIVGMLLTSFRAYISTHVKAPECCYALCLVFGQVRACVP